MFLIKNHFKILIITTGLILLNQCDKETIDSFDKFPSDIGNKWIYDYNLIIIPFGADSTLQYNDADTHRFEILVEVDKKLMLDKINIETLQFASKDINTPETAWYQYYTNNKDGLIYYAYSGGSYNVFAKKKNSLACNISEMLYPKSITNSEDSLFYLENPSMSLKYPLKTGSTWNYVKNNIVEIDKAIMDIVDIRTKAGNFECYKIKYLYKKFPSNIKIEWFEYYGSKGLIKREIYIDNVGISDAYGQIIKFVKAIELYELKDYTIND
ncbi:MAG: hypothetical protein JXB49_02385 [Bacteroidales bacterium]|nr:hypothetical protein [Bacteroidales bacterium]